jgi:hypothetical protein
MASAHTRYFKWEDDACRLHEDEEGTLTADVYRPGKGLLPIEPVELIFSASEISGSQYEDLIEEHDAMRAARR